MFNSARPIVVLKGILTGIAMFACYVKTGCIVPNFD